MPNIQTVYLGDHQCNDFYSGQHLADFMNRAIPHDARLAKLVPTDKLLDLCFSDIDLEEFFFPAGQ